MQKVKKYLSVSILLLTLPMIAFIGSHFILESSKDIYNFIPEESDIVIEVNTRNFVTEIMYQRIYEEAYFNEKIILEEGQVVVPDAGIDFFSSVIVFREQWADENIWMALLGYTDETKLTAYLNDQIPGAKFQFGSKFVLLQITPSSQQAEVDEHMKKIMNGEVKSFNERVNLSELFDQSKEINCYIMPQNKNEKNQLISGNLSFDFLEDHIKIDGEFIPVSGFAENEPVAYAMNEDAAFSLRSSLNIMHSIYWFNKEVIHEIPEYSQMVLDYHSMNMFMVHKKLGYPFSFKFFPKMHVKFDLINPDNWYNYFDTLVSQNAIKMDTIAHTFIENKIGFFFNYKLNDESFALMRDEVILDESTDDKLYFSMHIRVAPLLDNVTFAVDEQNPPSILEQSLGLMVAESMVEELKVISNVEDIRFELKLEDKASMLADGKIQMLNREGNSMIESLFFGKAAIDFFMPFIAGEPVE